MNSSLFPHLDGVDPSPQFKTLADQAEAAEAWETSRWAVEAILRVELLTGVVLDPCCGTGVITEVVESAGYFCIASDLYDWGFEARHGVDFLSAKYLEEIQDAGGLPAEFSVAMNPPFSKATDFVDRARELGARKILCFQRQAWRESDRRRLWWEANPPARVWLCGDRADSWLFSVPPEERAEMSGRNMPSAWYVWERGHKGAEIGGAIWRRS